MKRTIRAVCDWGWIGALILGLGCGPASDVGEPAEVSVRTEPAAPEGEAEEIEEVEEVEEAEEVEEFGLPDDFPADVPRYPGAELTTFRGNVPGMTIASFRTGDGYEEVADFFTESLSEEGWQVESTPSTLVPEHLVVAEKEGRSVTVAITGGEERTKVDLVLTGGARPGL